MKVFCRMAVSYVFDLPYSVRSSLATILDSTGSWKDLAGLMEFSHEIVLNLGNATDDRSPTMELLTDWGTFGHTTSELFLLLAKLGNVRAMKVMLPHVEPKYHKTLEELQQSTANRQVNRLPIAAAVGNSSADVSSQEALIRRQPQVRPSPSSGSDGIAAVKLGSVESSNSKSPNKGQSDCGLAVSLQSTLTIPFEELRDATNNFCAANILGRGGYGVVYYGYWKHTAIAVKRLLADATSHPSFERIKQSLSELQALSVYRHDNILPLYGYCLDGTESCLVYQYMAGGSLEDRTLCRHDTLPLTWPQKKAVLTGSARGLNYLHSCRKEPLIHGDIKSANILLDAHLEPKIGDFGLSRKGIVELPGNAPPMIASHIKGTLAYLPPEFIRTKRLSSKLDVFSFGVVLLEVATGLRAHSDKRSPEKLVDFVRVHVDLKQQTMLVDQRPPDTDLQLFDRLTTLALHCCSSDPDQRPTMDEVLNKLTGSY